MEWKTLKCFFIVFKTQNYFIFCLFDNIEIGDDESQISYSDYISIVSNGFPKKDDVLLTTVGTLGRSAVYSLEKPLAFQRSVLFIRLKKYILPRYLMYFFETDFFKRQIDVFAKETAQKGMYGKDICQMYCIYYDLDKQNEIIEFLDKKCDSINKLIKLKTDKIEKLKEYKRSLIYECVVGRRKI